MVFERRPNMKDHIEDHGFIAPGAQTTRFAQLEEEEEDEEVDLESDPNWQKVKKDGVAGGRSGKAGEVGSTCRLWKPYEAVCFDLTPISRS